MTSKITPHQLTCEYMDNPLGLTIARPRLAWIVESDERGESQTAYQILVADSAAALAAGQGTLWDSGQVPSDQTTHILYNGTPLQSNQRALWKVRVWDNEGDPSAYSDVATWQIGLLSPEDWQASWIGINATPEPELGLKPVVHLRRSFALTKPVAQATLYATAKGIYIPSLNGGRVGDAELAPGWTDYRKRFQVQTYDVTGDLQQGENVVGITLAEGWYSGYLGFQGIHNYYGENPRALLQLVIVHDDGTTTVIGTDDAWRARTGPIEFGDIQMGERYDARREMPGWNAAGFSEVDGIADAGWQNVLVEERDPNVLLEGQRDQAIRVTEETTPVEITEPTSGTYIFDLGQNIAGRARFRVTGSAGTEIRLRYGEMLEPDGTLHTANLRSARVTDFYVFKGEGVEDFEPLFTYHGFRYVEITGLAEAPTLDTVTGLVMHNDTPPTGNFVCSNEMVNQLWKNIMWGQRGNFVSIPTDCPQRDERLGWSGDAQIFCRTASFNMDVSAFFTKWMVDVVDTQTPDGAFTDIIPQIKGMPKAAPAWGDAGVIIPWTIYRVYGDTGMIKEHYEAMQAWMEYIAEANRLLLRTKCLNSNYSDWVSLEGGSSSEQISTAYWAKIARMMSEMASAIGQEADAEAYDALYEEIRQTYLAAYVHADGTIETDTQTAYILALDNDLLPESLRQAAADRLVAAVARHNGHLATGFLGTPPLCFVLAENGYLDVAYKLLTQDTFPSWGYMIRNGATTMWERWNAYTIEGGIHDPEMNSFNHYAYGSISEWLYRVVAGINAGLPGYKHTVLRPRPGGGLVSAQAGYRSIHGTIKSGWTIKDDGIHYEFSVPANTTATLEIETANPYTVLESGVVATEAEGVQFVRYEKGVAVFELTSGTFHFVASCLK